MRTVKVIDKHEVIAVHCENKDCLFYLSTAFFITMAMADGDDVELLSYNTPVHAKYCPACGKEIPK